MLFLIVTRPYFWFENEDIEKAVRVVEPLDKNNDRILTKPEVSGVVQKGPFLNGTSIGIYELNDDLSGLYDISYEQKK